MPIAGRGKELVVVGRDGLGGGDDGLPKAANSGLVKLFAQQGAVPSDVRELRLGDRATEVDAVAVLVASNFLLKYSRMRPICSPAKARPQFVRLARESAILKKLPLYIEFGGDWLRTIEERSLLCATQGESEPRSHMVNVEAARLVLGNITGWRT